MAPTKALSIFTFKLVLNCSAFIVAFSLFSCSGNNNGGCPFTPNFEHADGDGVSTPCNCNTAPTLVPGPNYIDWPQDGASQTRLWNWWVNGGAKFMKASNPGGSNSWTRLGNATGNYNCAGYILDSSAAWVNDVTPYIGTTSGCYKKDPSGTAFRYDTMSNSAGGNDFHICTVGYTGKCGPMFVQDHNDDIYGALADTYSQIP
jgi:hypothetical protein